MRFLPILIVALVLGATARSETTISRASTGLLFNEQFSSLAAWTTYGGSAYTIDTSFPEYVCFPLDRVLMDLAPSGPDSGGLREPFPVVLENGDFAIWYDSADAVNAWAAALATSTDNGLTMTRLGHVSLPNPSGYFSLCHDFTFKSGSTYYMYTLTSTADIGWGGAVPGTPGPPYGNSLYSAPDPIAGPWTRVSNNDPALISGTLTNNLYHVFFEPVSGQWQTYTSTQNWRLGKAHASSPLGPWTQDSVDFLPAAVTVDAENPRFWFSTELNRFVLSMNENGNQAEGLWYATTMANFGVTGQVKRTQILFPSATSPYTKATLSPGSPIFNLNYSVIAAEDDGAMGYVYGGDRQISDPFSFHRLRAAQLEPRPTALKFEDASGTFRYITRAQGGVNMVIEFIGEFTGSGQAMGFVFNASTDGTDANTSGYYLHISSSGTAVSLFRAVSGTFGSAVASGTTAVGVTVGSPMTADSLNRWHHRVKIAKSGGNIVVKFNGETVIDYTDGSPLSGTLCGPRTATSTVRILGVSCRTSDSVTIKGVNSGQVISLHGANKLPAVSGTASGPTIALSHEHYPLYGIQINGTYYSVPSGIWGGDVFERHAIIGGVAL